MNSGSEWLPKEFLKEMQDLLGEEYENFLSSFAAPVYKGMRCNSLKLSADDFENRVPFCNGKIPWTSNGFYMNVEEDRPSKHPYYYAGLYYIQEPSAMLPAALLPVDPGDRVLDLCAAPGGKTTELGAKLKGKGVLVCNDISASRAKALLKNIELFGIKNSVVVSETPARLSERFGGYFNKILVDAPCSGEGMFRKVHSIAKNWEQYGSGYYASLQRDILKSAVPMLAPGGYMLYSTCTFSVQEDEESLAYILENFPEMETADPGIFDREGCEGFVRGYCGYKDAVRIFPHKCKGEGHFAVLLRKKEDAVCEECGTVSVYPDMRKKNLKAMALSGADTFLKRTGIDPESPYIRINENRIFLMPEGLPELKGLRILRTGLFLGEMKTGRFDPSQALAMAIASKDFDNTVRLSPDDERVIRYLKCESIEADDDKVKDGLCLVSLDEFPLGWAKADRGRLKNKYLPSWRMQ